MKICIAGPYSKPTALDEGIKKICFHLAERLSKKHEVLRLSIPEMRFPLMKVFIDIFRLVSAIKRFDPQIVHFVVSPSPQAFILAKIIRLRTGNTKIVLSTLQRINYPPVLKAPFSLIKPDLVLVQSSRNQKIYTSLGFNTGILPSGVEIGRFTSTSDEQKKELRRKYGLSLDKFIILHVGHPNLGRGISMLKSCQRRGDQIIFVGSTSSPLNQQLVKELKDSGIIVWIKYFEHIEEIYALSDCYIFPTLNALRSIEMPLSVLEAMACNLPVLSTRFGALPEVFEEGNGLFFFDTEEELHDKLNTVKDIARGEVRSKVLPYDWDNVIKRLEELYTAVI